MQLAGGKPIIQDKTLRESLADLMKSDLYRHSTDGPDGGKKVLITGRITDYRSMAQHILTTPELSQKYLGKEFPELVLHIHEKRQKNAQRFNAPVPTP